MTDGDGGEAAELQLTSKVRMINMIVNRWRSLRSDLDIEDGSTQELERYDGFVGLNALLILSSGIKMRD